MRTAKLIAPRTFRVDTVAEPEPAAGEVLVRTDAVGICRSDIHYYQDGRIGDSAITYPFTLGHETAGTVVAHGPGVTAPAIGARVAIEPGIHCGVCEWCERGDPNLCAHMRFHGSPPVEGATRELFAHPAHLCIPLADGLSADDGVIIEPLAIGVHVNRLVKTRPGDLVAVFGCGPVGLLSLAVAHASGAERIIAIEPLAHRAALAKRFGAWETIVPDGSTDVVVAIMELTRGRGVDVVIEATSDPAVPVQAAHVAAFGARIALAGITDDMDMTMPTHVARRKGLTVRFVRRSKLAVRAAMGLVTSGKVSIGGLVTHHFPLAEVQRGFELVESYGENVFKAVVLPQK